MFVIKYFYYFSYKTRKKTIKVTDYILDNFFYRRPMSFINNRVCRTHCESGKKTRTGSLNKTNFSIGLCGDRRSSGISNTNRRKPGSSTTGFRPNTMTMVAAAAAAPAKSRTSRTSRYTGLLVSARMRYVRVIYLIRCGGKKLNVSGCANGGDENRILFYFPREVREERSYKKRI